MTTLCATATAKENTLLTDAQLKREIEKCEYCAEKPCKTACPCNCSPADFIMAIRQGAPSDYKRAAAQILSKNPLGGICGMVCPTKHCMDACTHTHFDCAVNIPAVQATIIAKARELGVAPKFKKTKQNGKKVAVIGSGPAGMAAAITLGQRGYVVEVYDSDYKPGGMCRCIPEHRLHRKMLEEDVKFIFSTSNVRLRAGKEISDPEKLLAKNYDAVIVAVGLWEAIMMDITHGELAIPGIKYLKRPSAHRLKGRVAVIGGGATALDCAITAKQRGAGHVEMIALENVGELPLTPRERGEMHHYGIDLTGRTRLTGIKAKHGKVTGLQTIKVELPPDAAFNLAGLKDVKNTEQVRDDVDHVIMAIGARSLFPHVKNNAVFYTGDVANGPTTVVEASAAGKNAAMQVDAFIQTGVAPKIADPARSEVLVEGYSFEPVSLETNFFGYTLSSPFLLSASPASDGYDQMKAAYDAGWPGGIMKTAFDGLPIHIPAAYMTCFDDTTWGNCDNVSDHSLSRVCKEIKRLVKEYPDRITGASTGGNVSGNDEADKASWQHNTQKLEKAGAMVIEYSLSCPQGGEGAEGDIVSQNAELTAKIIGWVLEISDPAIPKLFKLTSAVTDIRGILKAVKAVLKKYPAQKNVGVTLANTFPSLAFREGKKKEWEDGVVVGMSGEGVTPVSYLCLANAGGMGVSISGNAGPMNYRAAADFLALGTNSVQFCTIVEKYGYEIINDLKQGLSHLLEAKGIKSVSKLVGIAQPNPIRDFMDLEGNKQISACEYDFCLQCGNCTRCPYMAITLDKDKYPVTDPAKCIGCGLCTLQCFTGALILRDRTPQEKAMMV
ncbi:MAG: dihydropyrimidine dehydrogenase [Spartobacteria bacterium]|nr:dihydropyrimidine dehydrogenase [Spartobacteria bacterium]